MKFVADLLNLIGFFILMDWMIFIEWYVKYRVFGRRNLTWLDDYFLQKYQTHYPIKDFEYIHKKGLGFFFLLIGSLLSLFSYL